MPAPTSTADDPERRRGAPTATVSAPRRGAAWAIGLIFGACGLILWGAHLGVYRPESGLILFAAAAAAGAAWRETSRGVAQVRAGVEVEDPFRRMAEASTVGLLVGDLRGGIAYANPAILGLLGYDPDDVRSGRLRWDTLTPPEYAPRDAAAVEQLVASGVCTPYEKVYIGRDGRRVPILIGASALNWPPTGEVVIAAFVTDLTEQKRVEEELRRKEEQLRLFAESGIIGMISANIRGDVFEVNDEFLRIVGYSREDFRNGLVRWIDLTPPEWLPADARGIAEAQARGACTPYEKQFRRKDGEKVDVLVGYVLHGPGREEAMAFVLDIAERKHAERALRRREGEFQVLVEKAPDIIARIDREHRLVYVNPAIEKATGLARQRCLGQTFRGLGLPEGRAAWFEATLARVFAERREEAGEFDLASPDGPRWFHARFVPELAADGTVEFVLAVAGDITERKQAEAAIRASQERLRAIFDSTSVGIAVTDLCGRFLQVNRAYCTVTGSPEAELLDTDLLTITHPDDIPAKRASLDALLAGEIPSFVIEKRYVPRNGRVAWVQNSVSLLRDAEGRPENIIVLTQDISRRKAAEERLRESENRYRTLSEELPQLVWTCLPDGRCDYLSPQWVAYTGVPEAEQLGLNWLNRVIHPDDREATLACWRAAVEGRGEYDLEYRIRSAAGAYRWFKTRGIPIRDPEGRIVRWFGTCTDIHDKVLAEDALKEADRRKDEFLAMLAHELRNPLAAIHGALRLDQESDAREARAWAREVIERQVHHLSHLIDDLLDVCRISRGKIQLRREPMKLRVAIDRAAEAVRPLMERRHHRFTLDVSDRPMRLDADPTRVEQVLSNLLTNAAKYTDDGGRVRLSARPEGAEVVIEVEDNGVGIPPEMLAHVFDLFTQVDRTIDRSQGGLGIGLTLVRRLVEMHGGAVSARGGPGGRGSVFTVRLPALAGSGTVGDEASADGGPAPAARGAGRRVLVVDDNVDSALAIARLLRLHGHEVRTVHEGLAALDVAREFSPEVILLDIGLPGMDGYEVARRLRADDRLCRDRLIAISGYGQEQDRRRSKDAGFDHHLIKPVDFDVLFRLVEA